MRKTRFNCSESTLCNIAGVQFDQLTPQQRNQARILAMYFSTPETYHNDVLNEIRTFANDISLTVGNATVEQGVTYYPITSANNATPLPVKPSVEEMAEKLASRLNLPVDLVKTWQDSHIEIAFTNLGLMPRQKTDHKVVGYLLVDANSEYPRFKASAAEPSFVVKQYNEYVQQQRNAVATPTNSVS